MSQHHHSFPSDSLRPMLRRCGFCGTALLLLSIVLVGCKSFPANQEQTELSASEGKRAGNGATTKQVEAHAHYAAGVIHEINNDSEAALEEYYKAALYDPEN